MKGATTVERGVKVVTIGGGSSYTPELVEGFIQRQDTLPVRELWLVDVEAGSRKLETVCGLANRMVAAAGVDMQVIPTLDRRKALEGADFVTTQFRVGYLGARAKDERIPAQYGFLGQETNGAGGMFKALRTIPVIMDILADCEELCPNAWVINFANPAGLNCEAIFRYTNWRRFIGLCNSTIGIQNRVARLMGCGKDDLRIDFAGLNHLVFGLRTYLHGRDISGEVIETLAQYNEGKAPGDCFESFPYTPEFIRALGVVPGPYLRYYYAYHYMLKDALAAAEGGSTRAEEVAKLEKELFAQYASPQLDHKPRELEKRGGAFYSDAACNLVQSLYLDRQDIQVVNTLNNGAIQSLADDEVVEVSCVITKDGPRPLTFGRLPIQVEGLVRQIKSFERITAQAAVTGSYNDTVLALTINPLCMDERSAKAMVDDLLQAHRPYLPRFFS